MRTRKGVFVVKKGRKTKYPLGKKNEEIE